MKFSDYGIDERILKGTDKAGYENCTDVQAETLKHSIQGKDVLVQSQTGTGKTAAFLVTVFQLLLTRKELDGKKVLILAPTRELAIQIEKEAKLLGSFLDLKIGAFYGGVGYNAQDKLLKDGVDIVIGTPGRLMDYGNSGKLKFKDFSVLVIDEADRMFDMGFFPDIRRMLRKMSPAAQRISLLFSATMSLRVKNLAWEYMNEPVEINMSPEQITVDKINQVLYHVGAKEKMGLLLGLLKKHNPHNGLVFTNTKNDAMKVAGRLSGNGYNCNYIIGDLPQKKRSKIIESIKSGELKFLVATDVAARGLHIDDLDMVINYDVPEDYENYVHRIGRTARAGKSGLAITMACEKFVYGIEAIENYIKMKIPIEWADDELFVKDETTREFLNSYLKSSDRKPSERKKPAASKKKKPAAAEGRGSGAKKAKASQAKGEAVRNPKKAAASGKGKAKAKVSDTQGASKKAKKPAANSVSKKTSQARLPKNASLEDRMEFYKQRYGEDFTVMRETGTSGQTQSGRKPKKKNAGNAGNAGSRKKTETVNKQRSKKPAAAKTKKTPEMSTVGTGKGRLEDKGLLSSIISLFKKKDK